MKLRSGDLLVGMLALTLSCIAYVDRRSAEWIALGLVILAGIPHGSFDLRAAERWWGTTPARRISLLISYVTVGLCMSALCLQWPGVGLAAFLIISAIHFSEGEMLHTTRLTAVCFGIAAIVLPISLHIPEASQYLGFFASQGTLEALAYYLLPVGVSLVIALAVSLVLDFWKGGRSELLQHVICIFAWLLLPPLSGFCVWFIGRHSRQHLERCKFLVSTSSARKVPWDFIALSITAIALLTPLAMWFDMSDLNQLFAASIVLIAGLTLPHMIVTHLGSDKGAATGATLQRSAD